MFQLPTDSPRDAFLMKPSLRIDLSLFSARLGLDGLMHFIDSYKESLVVRILFTVIHRFSNKRLITHLE